LKKSEILAQELAELKAKEKPVLQHLKAGSVTWSDYYAGIGKAVYAKEAELKKQIEAENRRDVQVGDGVTLYLYSDSWACTVIAKTKNSITLQRDKATLDPDFKPEFIPGGFSAHCINNSDQSYSYERDPNGATYKAYWSEKEGRYKCWQGEAPVGNGRNERYDYNF